MRTIRRGPIGLTAALLFTAFGVGQAPADRGDNRWATALSNAPFGFDDMAETVFRKMVEDPGRTPTERLEGRTGIAALKLGQARSASTFDAKMKLFDEAVTAIEAVKKEWPDKTQDGYFNVVFRLTEMLQQRGETTMEAALDGKTSEIKADELKSRASSDFTKAKVELDAIRQQFKDADEESADENQRHKWLLRLRAWLSYCDMLYKEGATAKEGSVTQGTRLAEASRELDDFILTYESGSSFDATLGALWGHVYQGKVKRAMKDVGEAVNSYNGVISQVRWDRGDIPPSIQALAELAYFELLDALNADSRYEDARKQGEEMQARFKNNKVEVGVRGRAALVELARTYFESGEFSKALGLAGEIARDGKSDISGSRATKLIARIIASAPDKRQFNPEILLNAANGAYQDRATGPEKRAEAVQYFRLALPVLDRIKDEKQRFEAAVEAWFKYAYCLQEDGLLLEASHAYAEGYKSTWAKRPELLSSDSATTFAGNLFTNWKRTADEFIRQSGSKEAQKLLEEFADVAMKFPPPKTTIFSAGDTRYGEALELERRGQFAEAADKFEEVSGKPPLYKDGLGGRFSERSIVKAATCRSKSARNLVRSKDPSALAALNAAIATFEGYLKLAQDPGRRETDPTKAGEREIAQADAKWNITELKRDLIGITKDAEAVKKLHGEIRDLLANFETLHAKQESLVLFGVANRADASLGLGDLASAERDYRSMRAIDATSLKTAVIAQRLGFAMKAEVDARRKAIDPKNEAALAATKPEMAKYAEIYRDWLKTPGLKEAKNLTNWSVIGKYFFEADRLTDAAEIFREALEKFADLASSDQQDLNSIRYFLARANDATAERLIAEGKDATRLFDESDGLVTALMREDASNRYSKYRDVLRMAARTWGGFLYQEGQNYKFYPGRGDYKRALDVWRDRVRPVTESGSDEYWESTFYTYYLVYRLNEANKQPHGDLRKKFLSLKATNPDFGGAKWKPWFEFLDRALPLN